MMNHVLSLDVAPDPVSTGIGVTGLVLIGVLVLMLAAAALTGFVFLIKRLRRNANGAGTRLVVGDVCLNLNNAAPQSNSRTNTAR